MSTPQQKQTPKVCKKSPNKTAKPKKSSGLKKLVQKFNPKPIKNANVRFDSDKSAWARLDENMNPVEHFDLALMKKVTFKTHRTEEVKGCYASTTHIGIASGDLYLHRGSDKTTKARNLSFKGESGFFGPDDESVTEASQVLLMKDRHSLYWK